MIYNYSELLKIYKNRYQIDKAIKNKEIIKVEKGIYSNTDYPNEIEIISKKYPNAIFTMGTAFYHYGLTDVIPEKYELAIKENRKKITNNKIKVYSVSKIFFEVGKIKEKIDFIEVNIYDRERLLIELIRNRNTITYEDYKEIITNYRNISNDLEIRKIEKYIKFFKNGDNIFETIRKEVF